MAECDELKPAVPTLEGFFASKKKKKIRAVQMTGPTAPAEPLKKKKVDVVPEEWHDGEVETKTMKVQEIGEMPKVEKEEEEVQEKAVWANARKPADGPRDERKYPTLAKGATTSAVALRNEQKVSAPVEVSRNRFADIDSDEPEEKKRPTFINSKKQGEMTKAKAAAGDAEKAASPPTKPQPAMTAEEREKKEKKLADKEAAKARIMSAATDTDDAADEDALPSAAAAPEAKIAADPEASQAKYEDRRKLPLAELPASELYEEKEAKPEEGEEEEE